MKHIGILLGMLLILSCGNKEAELQGLWESAYLYSDSLPERYATDKTFMHFAGDSILLVRFGNPYTDSSIEQTRAKYSWTSTGIQSENDTIGSIEILEKTADSLVVFFGNREPLPKQVYKRVPPKGSKVGWNPVGKHYLWEGNTDSMITAFFENGNLMNYNLDNGTSTKGKWKSMSIAGQHFMVFENLQRLPHRIDSIGGDRVFISIREDKNYSYEFIEVPPDQIKEDQLK